MPRPTTIEIPRLVFAGTGSGTGKTSIVLGLTRALRARGLRVAVFKVGPDYLDPTYHSLASGRACHNLDGWMMGRDAVVRSFARAVVNADIALIEGVMGLFDGADATTEIGSTAELAKWLQAPVALCVDASGMARTVAAIAEGARRFDPALRLGAILANRVGSRRHLALLEEALSAMEPPVALAGGLPKDAAPSFPARHLGLQTASHGDVPETLLDAWGAAATEWLDIEMLLAVAATAGPVKRAPSVEDEDAPAAGAATARCRIGVAQDPAFHFYYEDNLAQLEALGAELVHFSPIADRALPEVDGLLLGGGYPEVHARALSENQAMHAAIRDFHRQGGPIYAECGGLIYLSESIASVAGEARPMVGLIAGRAQMHQRLQALGYVQVETTVQTCLGPAGLQLRGHQFRYSELEGAADAHLYRMRRRRDGQLLPEGHGGANLLASYVHLHWARCPEAASGLVDQCVAFRSTRRRQR